MSSARTQEATLSAGLGRLVERAAGLTYSALPDATVKQVELLIADAVGVAIAGARKAELSRYAAKSASTREARVLVGGDRWAEASVAAFINGCAGVALELDDGLVGGGHGGAHVIPAALAAAQRQHSSGRELIAAVTAGYEVAARLFRTFRLRYPAHPHGHLGAVGGAVAVALLTGVPPIAAARIASTLPILSTWSACFEGVSARNAVVGVANMIAVKSADLADAGFIGGDDSLAQAFGEVAGELRDSGALEREIDVRQLAVHSVITKHFSVAGPLHCAVQAARQVARPGPISQVVVETVANNMKFSAVPRRNDLSTRFSLPYAVAAALCRNPRQVDAFDYDHEVAALAARVKVNQAADLDERFPGSHAARVVLSGPGSELIATVVEPMGSPGRPASEAELKAKFLTLCEDDGADHYRRLMSLRQVDDCADLIGDVR